MKRNRKRTRRMAVVASSTMHVFGVMVVLFAMVIVNMLASSSCTQLQKTIGEKERKLAQLEQDRERENARWDALRIPDNLEKALFKLGLDMKYPKSTQIVKMRSDGMPAPAQNSVLLAQRRQAPVLAASYKTPAPAVRTTAQPVRARVTRRTRR